MSSYMKLTFSISILVVTFHIKFDKIHVFKFNFSIFVIFAVILLQKSCFYGMLKVVFQCFGIFILKTSKDGAREKV